MLLCVDQDVAKDLESETGSQAVERATREGLHEAS